MGSHLDQRLRHRCNQLSKEKDHIDQKEIPQRTWSSRGHAPSQIGSGHQTQTPSRSSTSSDDLGCPGKRVGPTTATANQSDGRQRLGLQRSGSVDVVFDMHPNKPDPEDSIIIPAHPHGLESPTFSNTLQKITSDKVATGIRALHQG